MFAVFLDQQIDGVLRYGYPPYQGLGLGPGEGQLAAGVFDVLLADGDRLVHPPELSLTGGCIGKSLC